DPTQVRQVLMNLVTNAAEALGEGPRRIVISLEEREVNAEALERYLGDGAAPGTYVSLDVEDTGCGMDAETIARIYDPFFTTKFKGRGLGMAAVLGIIRSHGGAIAVDSRPGQGTKVSVLWPVKSVERREQPLAQTTPGARATVLVVDDDDGVRGLL